MSKIRDIMASMPLDIKAGGPGSGCRGENCGRKSTGKQSQGGEKVSNVPDQTGRIPVPAHIAQKGADIAQRWNIAENQYDSAARMASRVQYNKSGGLRTGSKAKREIAEAEKEVQGYRNRARQYSQEADNFKKDHGITVVEAWEAHHDQNWPYYRVERTAGVDYGRRHYVPKS